MQDFRYLSGVSTLKLDPDACTGCGLCTVVCPHGVMALENNGEGGGKGKKAKIVDLDGCMECGACANNCPTDAVQVTPGVGCATYIIQSWIYGKEAATCGVNCC